MGERREEIEEGKHEKRDGTIYNVMYIHAVVSGQGENVLLT